MFCHQLYFLQCCSCAVRSGMLKHKRGRHFPSHILGGANDARGWQWNKQLRWICVNSDAVQLKPVMLNSHRKLFCFLLRFSFLFLIKRLFKYLLDYPMSLQVPIPFLCLLTMKNFCRFFLLTSLVEPCFCFFVALVLIAAACYAP